MPEQQRPLTRQEVAISNLENKLFQQIVGANAVRKDPNLFGSDAYETVQKLYAKIMSGEDVTKKRDEMHQERLEERDRLGVADEPPYPSNYDVSSDVIKLIDGASKELPLGMLEVLVKKYAKLENDVPDQLKEIRFEDIVKAGIKNSQFNPDALSDKQKDAYQLYGTLEQAYIKAVAKNLIDTGTYIPENKAMKIIAEKYKPSAKAA